MKLPSRRVLLTAVAVTALSGCTALEIREANQQLTSLYQAKYLAEQSGDHLTRLNAVAALDQLADDAGAEAPSAMDRRNKIAFYRIAGTAAWQAGDSEATNGYAESGKKACGNDGSTVAPRDCGMLEVVQVLRGVDEQSDDLDAVRTRIDANRGTTVQDREDALRIFDRYSLAFKTLMAQRETWTKASMPDGFIEGVDANLHVLVCAQLDEKLMGVIRDLGDRGLKKSTQSSIDGMKCEMGAQGVPPARVPCISGTESAVAPI